MRWVALLVALLVIAFALAVVIRAQELRGAANPAPTPQRALPDVSPKSLSGDIDDNDPLGRPRSIGRDLQIVKKPHFTIGFDNARREPAWVSYHLAGPIIFHGKEH